MQDKTLKTVILVNFILWVIDLDFSQMSPLKIISLILWVVIGGLLLTKRKKD